MGALYIYLDTSTGQQRVGQLIVYKQDSIISPFEYCYCDDDDDGDDRLLDIPLTNRPS